MEQKFFTINDDFESIIKKHIKEVKKITRVETGWTNFVFKVNNGKNNYYFRFPNNDHFSLSIIKEFAFNKYIKDKIKLRIPNLKLYYDDFSRPYTKHLEIKGESLTDCYDNLTEKERLVFSKDIMKLLKQFQSIDYRKEQNINFEKVSDYLYKVLKVCSDEEDEKYLDKLKKLELKNMTISHGDLNPGNLILKNNKLVAVLDFAFSGISNELADLTRLVGRLPNSYKNLLIENYEKLFNVKINPDDIEDLLILWRNIEEKYIIYLKTNHTYIKLPNKL